MSLSTPTEKSSIIPEQNYPKDNDKQSIEPTVDERTRTLVLKAEPPQELFAVYAQKEGYPFLELKPRSVVHAEGLLHKSVNVFLVRADQVLLQKRSTFKKIEPSKWDVSVAEHLQYPESFVDAAKRGLKEELGLSDEEVNRIDRFTCLREGTTHHVYTVTNPLDQSTELIKDFELSRLYVAHLPDECTLEVRDLSEAEVSEVRWVSVGSLATIDANEFTPWARNEIPILLHHLGISTKQ